MGLVVFGINEFSVTLGYKSTLKSLRSGKGMEILLFCFVATNDSQRNWLSSVNTPGYENVHSIDKTSGKHASPPKK